MRRLRVAARLSQRGPLAWPKDIPTDPGANINGSLVTGKGGMLMLETSDTLDP